jgi:hypothetical protein
MVFYHYSVYKGKKEKIYIYTVKKIILTIRCLFCGEPSQYDKPRLEEKESNQATYEMIPPFWEFLVGRASVLRVYPFPCLGNYK